MLPVFFGYPLDQRAFETGHDFRDPIVQIPAGGGEGDGMGFAVQRLTGQETLFLEPSENAREIGALDLELPPHRACRDARIAPIRSTTAVSE